MEMVPSKELRVKATFDLFVRFVDKVDWAFSGCQLWKGRTDKDGYGIFQIGCALKTRAQRAAYALYFGAVSGGKNVCHTCDTPGCVRREHLWEGTSGDNNCDRARKGRSAVGWRNGGAWNGSARLTDDEVIAILEDPRSHMEIAKTYGIGHASVSDIKNGGPRWRHVTKGRTDRRGRGHQTGRIGRQRLQPISTNTSGVTGVRWHRATGRWAADIQVNQRRISLGYFGKFEEAVGARRAAELNRLQHAALTIHITGESYRGVKARKLASKKKDA
jgi:hypothetical protein